MLRSVLSSVSHQNMNSASVIPAPVTGIGHQEVAVEAAVIVPDPVGVSTARARSSQPQACATAKMGAVTRTKVTTVPSSKDSAPTSTVAALGAM